MIWRCPNARGFGQKKEWLAASGEWLAHGNSKGGACFAPDDVTLGERAEGAQQACAPATEITDGGLAVFAFEVFHEAGKGLDGFERNGVVDRSAHAAD